MNKRENKLIVEFDEDKIKILSEWKKRCLNENGVGGIKKRVQEIVEEDLKKLNGYEKRGK